MHHLALSFLVQVVRDTVFVATPPAAASLLAPTVWQLIVTLAGVASFMVLLVTFGIAYGKITERLAAVEILARAAAKREEAMVMFQEIQRRLTRMEDKLDNPHHP